MMDEIKDRRSVDRFLCNEATVLIFKKYGYQYFRYRVLKNIAMCMPKMSHVQDISRSGTLILSKNVFKRGDEIRLIISVPGTKAIIIKGTVKWNSTNTFDLEHIGIQFLAFSNWKKYNSFNILKQLNLYILSKNQSSIIEY